MTDPTPHETAAALSEADYDYDDSCGECFQCGGEGYVSGCSWDWQCDTWDGDSCLCQRRCDICNPAPRNPELDAVMRAILEQHHD